MRRLSAQLSLSVVTVLLGVLLVVQIFAYTRPSAVSEMSAQDLSELIETLSAGNRQLRAAVVDLRNQVSEYEDAEAQGASLLDVAGADLERVGAFAGVLPVEGQGIVVDVTGDLDAVALNELLNELRNAGAEALAVDDVRVTAASVAVEGGETLEVDGTPVGSTFTIRAIGSPDGLLTALQRPGGIASQLEQFIQATIDARSAQRIELPATTRDLTPQVAQTAG
ncbi:MAG: DUF881 domain-containing protein [Chloroflexota bacterium]|nr:DUF881 domain-containing protein [Chloroflexota bacterium]